MAARTAREHGMTDEAGERDPQVRARGAGPSSISSKTSRAKGAGTASAPPATNSASARPARDRRGCPHLLFPECLDRRAGGWRVQRRGPGPRRRRSRFNYRPAPRNVLARLARPRLRAPPAPISRPRPLHPGPPCGHLAGDRRRVRERDSGKSAWAPEQRSGRVLDPSTRRQSFALFTSRDLTVGCKTVKRYAGVRAQ